MKYINLSSLSRDSSETVDILSLSAKKALSLDLTVITTSGSINNFSTTEESSFKFTLATEITGFSGGNSGKLLYIYNGNASSGLVLKNDSTSSSSGNRILTNTGSDLTIPANGGTILQYDSDSTVWRVASSGGGGGTSPGTILDTYINSKTVIINNNSTSDIQTIYSQVISGIYTFWVSSDPRIKGIFYLNENDLSNSVLESISSSVSSKLDNAGTLNVYISGVNIIIQNKLGSNITLCIRRETTPLINPEPGNVSIANHNNLYGLQGGLTNTYYHSNQPINTTDTVLFNGINATGNITATGSINTTNTVTFGSVSIPITTTNATGTINDVSTSNIGGYRFTSTSALTITGFANGINGEILYLQNASSVNVTIKNSSSLSLASNRILTGNGSDFVLKPDRGATLQYDSFSLRWRILGGAGGNPSENPETLNFSNSPATIDFSQYATTSFRIKNPAQITLSNGTNGVWYTLAIVSDGAYSFTSETRFPLNNAQPVPSSGTVDLYTFHCIDTVSGTRYLATFAYDYSGVILP